ncbi:hypothetical protein M948_19345 [Virgibacillus sp. CM-4]|nr:hypothetical protein M948_19345 [Virgibacillus sp. CM-4]
MRKVLDKTWTIKLDGWDAVYLVMFGIVLAFLYYGLTR